MEALQEWIEEARFITTCDVSTKDEESTLYHSHSYKAQALSLSRNITGEKLREKPSKNYIKTIYQWNGWVGYL